MKFQPVQSRQISLYDYMWKLSFVQARRDSFSPGICLDLYAFSLNSSLNFFCLSFLVLLPVSFLFHKIRSSRSQMFLKFRNIHRKTYVLESLFSKTGDLNAYKETPIQVFSYEYCKIFKNTFLPEYIWWLLLENDEILQKHLTFFS